MSQSLPTLFGRLVRQRRLAAGLSQEDLADKTELSRNYIGMIERGETNPTLIVLHEIAVALDTSMTELIRTLEKELRSEQEC